jgi:hypothetical protein
MALELSRPLGATLSATVTVATPSRRARRVPRVLTTESTPRQQRVADEDDAAGESPDASRQEGGTAVFERAEQEEKPERDFHHSEQHAGAGTLALEFVAGPETAEDVGKSCEQDHYREQIENTEFSDDVVEAVVEEHDESGDDAGTARYERDTSRSFAREPSRRPWRARASFELRAAPSAG